MTVRSLVAGAAAGATVAAMVVHLARPDVAPATGPDAFPTCVIRVFEDGSATFRDAEAVRDDPSCWPAVVAHLRARGVWTDQK